MCPGKSLYSTQRCPDGMCRTEVPYPPPTHVMRRCCSSPQPAGRGVITSGCVQQEQEAGVIASLCPGSRSREQVSSPRYVRVA